VIVPTHARSARLAELLRRCDAQTLAPERFELIVVDDGSPEPVRIDPHAHRFALTLVRQEQAGPGAARNLALEHCRGELTLLFSDDALPAPDLFEQHVLAHASRAEPCCIRGSFEFTDAARQHPFVQALHADDLLFEAGPLRDGELHAWPFFRASNTSLPTEALIAVGGFDAATFREAAAEDVELGYRLAQRGSQVLYLADLACEHDHVFDSTTYFRRMVRFGVNVARMYAKHGDKEILRELQGGEVTEQFFFSVQSTCEAFYTPLSSFQEKLLRLEESHVEGTRLDSGLVQSLRALTRQLGLVAFYRGMLLEIGGKDPAQVLVDGPPTERLTSVVVVADQGLNATRRCVEALRRAADERHPTEILALDLGSTDGTSEYLAAQRDLTRIECDGRRGTARAKNQALAQARGDWVVMLTSDAQVAPGWLARMLYHAEVDAKSGCVGPVSDHADHGQQVMFPLGPEPESVAAFAKDRAVSDRHGHIYSAQLTGFFLLFRREVVRVIGGFDERFARSGLEDDDFTLRASLAGFRNRIALDVFVQRGESQGAQPGAQEPSEEWAVFRAKWGLPAAATRIEESHLAQAMRRSWTLRELHLPFESRSGQTTPALAPALPRGAVRAHSEKAGHWNG
jgi:GT2 family glycosyltransferase